MNEYTDNQANTEPTAAAVAAIVNSIQEDQAKIGKAATSYENAVVSASCSVGPKGAGLQGWITYTSGGEKIYFQATGNPNQFYGLFAGGGALALVGALDPAQLSGHTGRYRFHGNGGGGTIELWTSSGQPVLSQVIPVVGAGIPFSNWKAEGSVSFTLHK